MTPENEAKKAFLSRYRWDKVALEEICKEIDACRMGALPGGINYDGMPHGTNNSDLSDYAVKYAELREKLKTKREQLLDDLAEISNAIEAVEDPRSNILLRYRYIQLKPWHEIAQYMSFNEVYVKRELHGEALEKFQLPAHFPTKSYTDMC